jgi:ribosomal protein S18 acetylase RimI-like enzyme
MDAKTYRTQDVLREGGPVWIRAMRPDDKALLSQFHARLSTESVYLRYFEFKPLLSHRDLQYLTELDFARRVALVATQSTDALAPIVGVARYDVLPLQAGKPVRAELGIVVEDACQNRGIGTVLLKHLLGIAHDHGIEEVTAEVLPQNSRMLDLVAGAGVPIARSLEEGVIRLTV